MIYIKDENGQIRRINSWQEIGFLSTQITDEEEIAEFEFEKAKKEKLEELAEFYASNELWTFTVKDGEGNSLTRQQDWLLPRITRNIFLISNEGKEVFKTIEDPEEIRAELNNIGTKLFKKKVEILEKIQKAKTIQALEKIDIKKEFENINKEIIVE